MSPLVSIILPTRNRLKTIQRTVEHIQQQSFTDWELIISDNASDEEGKVQYLRHLAEEDSRVRLHLQEVNIGIHNNWKFCIEKVRGRYYIPVTDDDWWGGGNYLQDLLEGHDGETASVFPNMCIHHVESGQIDEDVLTPVYGGVEDRYAIYERLLQDGKGVVMIGLIDLEVFPKEELISVVDNDLAIAIETLGMHRLVRNYKVRFCETARYCHSYYSGNYCNSFGPETLAQDRGIVSFRLLDEIRQASRQDPGFENALAIQWRRTLDYCEDLVRKIGSDARVQEKDRHRRRIDELKQELREVRRELSQYQAASSTLLGSFRLWLRQGKKSRP